ncbi:MAG TPA: cytochrome P450 [Pilimelia sp.]|nr:cytochrome P450 [Pilimelia sp.]
MTTSSYDLRPRTAVTPRLDALQLASEDDPYPAYAELRRAGPLCRGTFGEWLVPRHAEVTALLRDPRLSAELPAEYVTRMLPDSPAGSFLDRIMLTRNPPMHTHLRRLMGHAFSEPVVRRLQARVGDLADGLLASALERGGLDLVEDLGVPLPVMVVCELIGIPEADRPAVWQRVATLNKAFDAPKRTSGDLDTMNASLPWLRDYMAGLLADGRATPGGNPLSRLGGDGTALADEYIVDNALFLLHAGVETSMGLVSNGCAALLRFPDQLARLRADPGLVPTAIDEFLRYDPPIQGSTRLATEPIEIGGQKIRKGRAVRMLLGSANRDERVFAEPAALDVGRRPNPHVGFGGGVHHCLGSALARLVGTAVFDRLVRRCAVIEPAGAPVRRRHASLRSYAHLPVTVRPG